MNKINFKRSFLFTIFLFIGFTITMLTYKSSEEKTLLNLNNGYISKNAIKFDLQKISSNNDSPKFKSLSNFENNITIYTDITKYIKGVYFSGKGIVPPIYEGSFFSDVDFSTNENIAVIGKNVEISKRENGNEYIVIDNKYFRVIGYTGIKDSSLLDNMIYIPINENDFLENGTYILEGYNSYDNYFTLKDNLKDNFTINKLNKDGDSINRVFNNSIINKSSDFIIWYIFTLNIISITYYSIKQSQKKIHILNICGISYFNIFRNCFTKNIIISILSYSLGFIICLVIISTKSDGYVFKDYFLSLKNIYFTSIIMYLTPMILFSFYFVKKELSGEKTC